MTLWPNHRNDNLSKPNESRTFFCDLLTTIIRLASSCRRDIAPTVRSIGLLPRLCLEYPAPRYEAHGSPGRRGRSAATLLFPKSLSFLCFVLESFLTAWLPFASNPVVPVAGSNTLPGVLRKALHTLCVFLRFFLSLAQMKKLNPFFVAGQNTPSVAIVGLCYR